MLTHYCVIAFKNIWKYKVSSSISILGLAFALVCFVPILYWMDHETTYDSFYKDSESIYRVYSVEKQSGKVNKGASRGIENSLREQIPAIEASTVLMLSPENCRTQEIPYIQMNMLYTDSTFLEVFPQAFVCGEINHPLQVVNNMILSESMAIRLFGDAGKAIGQPVHTLMRASMPPYIVTAVVKDPPAHTNLPFDAIIDHNMIQHFSQLPPEAQWSFFVTDLYVKLHPNADSKTLANPLKELPERVGVNKGIELRALPIREIRHHLNEDTPFTLNFIGLFVVSGALLLFAAIFNFLNSYMDLFRQRVREWRLRTVNGATRKQLIGQMSVELGCSAIMSLSVTALFVIQVKPLFARWLEIDLATGRLMFLFAGVGAGTFLIIQLAGLLFFGRFSHTATTSLVPRETVKPLLLRRMAVTLQLVISILFIVASVVVMEQMRFASQKDLGFDRKGLIQLSGFVDVSGKIESALMQELSALPQVKSFTDTNFKPQHHVDPMAIFTNVEWEGKAPDTEVDFHLYGTDHRFGETFGLEMLAGRWWTEGNELGVVLNESAVRVMGLQNPVGSIIRMPWWSDFSVIKEYEIVGVVKDFHTLSFRERIHPMLFIPSGGLVNNLYVRAVPGEEGNVIRRITELLPKIDPTLADTRLTPIGTLYDQLNQSETVGLKIFSFLAFACLLISLFGIYAVATASTKRRRKEIAIRKVVGSKASEIILLFFREYMRLIAIAGLIAFPIGYFVMDYWLQGYAYRIQIQAWWLAGIFIAITGMVLFTIWKQVFKAANENPSEVIKSE
ncbi:ABC transporter permease [uncultured Parabacteroides sp.]|uniref:ABC transporter permease n=1 Tax=uncultured Parabacteroides sp. TaxID=512312 RepID=UPI002609B880|nr:ABC transporter permease [uncultured Parabacteroides sp.]